MIKEFHYVNDLGCPKKLVVNMIPNDKGEYPITLWDMRHGEFCGANSLTKEKINEWLEHYGLTDRL